MHRIVLIGPMGSGKSTLGKRLAKHLNYSFVDTDKVFTKRHGSISSFFEVNGEDKFRDFETGVLKELLAEESDGVVIATGGGIVLRAANRELLHDQLVIFLDTTADQVANRLSTDKRPLLKDDPNAWSRIYEQRLPLYQQVAKETLVTAGKPIVAVVKELVKIVERWD